MTIHPPPADVSLVTFLPSCRYGDWRCTTPATVWLVDPDGRAISVMCELHAGMVLDGYAAMAPEFPELVGWRGAPVEVAVHP